MQFLIFSDIHVFPHKKSQERLQDCLTTLEWVFQTAKDRGIKNILFCGDLFHDRQRIDVLTYQRTFEIFRKFVGVDKDSPKIYLLLGNHDLWHYEQWDVSSVYPLEAIAGVEVINKPCTVRIAGHDVSFLPYTHNPSEDLAKIKNTSKTKILLGHIAIDGALLNVMHGTEAEVEVENDGDMTKVTADIFKGWDQVFLGHYHAEQKLGLNAEYVGSPLQLSFGEAFQHKHIIVFDPDTLEKEYIRNKFSPQHFIIPEDDIGKYKLDKNFIRVVVKDITSSNIVEMRNDIMSKHDVGSFEVKLAKRKVEDDLLMLDDAKSIMNQGDDLKVFVEATEKQKGLGELEKDELLRIGKWLKEMEMPK
jgi:DNA repair exonuclease SbcCD nuclease subunit